MSFKDWLFGGIEGSKVVRWGLGHILTLVGCILAIVVIALLFKNKDKKVKKRVLNFLVLLILFFEIARRVVNLIKTTDYSFLNILKILLPRPWCAISCWVLIFSALIKKKFLYNFASISALLCAIIFFAWPGVGFKCPDFLFDDLYSVATHSLLLITSISLMTLGFTKFRYKKIWKVVLCFVLIFAYALAEIYFKIEDDPLYFMKGNDIHSFLGINYYLYLTIYFAFLILFINIFYLIQKAKDKKKKIIK